MPLIEATLIDTILERISNNKTLILASIASTTAAAAARFAYESSLANDDQVQKLKRELAEAQLRLESEKIRKEEQIAIANACIAEIADTSVDGLIILNQLQRQLPDDQKKSSPIGATYTATAPILFPSTDIERQIAISSGIAELHEICDNSSTIASKLGYK